MASFFALYPEPDDVDGFEEHYRDTHMAMVDDVPGVEDVRTHRVTGTPRGADAPFHVVTEIIFASEDALQEALRSDAFREMGRDAAGMAQNFGTMPVMLLTGPFAS